MVTFLYLWVSWSIKNRRFFRLGTSHKATEDGQSLVLVCVLSIWVCIDIDRKPRWSYNWPNGKNRWVVPNPACAGSGDIWSKKWTWRLSFFKKNDARKRCPRLEAVTRTTGSGFRFWWGNEVWFHLRGLAQALALKNQLGGPYVVYHVVIRSHFCLCFQLIELFASFFSLCLCVQERLVLGLENARTAISGMNLLLISYPLNCIYRDLAIVNFTSVKVYRNPVNEFYTNVKPHEV